MRFLESLLYYHILATALLMSVCLGATTTSTTSFPSVKKMHYSFDMKNVNMYLHRTAFMALMKAKAKSIINSPGFPTLEKLVFLQCQRDAKSPVEFARCVVALFKVRDSMEANPKWSSYNQEDEINQRPLQLLKDFLSIFRPIPTPQLPQITYQGPSKLPKTAPLTKLSRFNRLKLKKSLAISKNIHKLRVKRQIPNKQALFAPFSRRLHRLKTPKFRYLADLNKLRSYTVMLNKCKTYMERVNTDNNNYIRRKRAPVNYELVENAQTRQPLDEFENIMNKISQTKLLSPRILSFWPGSRKPHLMSPNLLSFEKDGAFSIPEIMNVLSVNDHDKRELLELLLLISGAGRKLSKIMNEISPQMDELKEKVYPAILKMEELERNFGRVKRSLSKSQQADMREIGYAFLNPDQRRLIYGSSLFESAGIEESNHLPTEKADLDLKLENDIRELARLEMDSHVKRRRKREDLEESEEEDPWPHWNVLRPWAFTNRVHEGVILEAIILSPHAFFVELNVSMFFVTEILSPRAFQPSFLSPAALLSRILSPLAFGVEILSPRFLAAYILSPEAFTAEILSPQFLEAHILSPTTFLVQVLSPNIIGPRVGSPESHSILILSPNILSPRVLSQERAMIEILSPHILGGEETEEEEESNLHNENELPEEHKYHRHSLGIHVHPGHEFGIFP